MFVEYVSPGLSPELPAGFDDGHSFKGETKDRKLAIEGRVREVVGCATLRPPRRRLLGVSDAELEDTRGGKLPPIGADGLRYVEPGGPSPGDALRPVRRRCGGG